MDDVEKSGPDMSALEARLAAVEKIQATNVPKFLNALKRLARMEKTVLLNAASIAEFKAILKSDADLRAANAAKLDDILGMMTAAKTVGGFVRKHGPRVLAFLIGAGVATGKISAETGQNFLHLFGL